MIKKYTGRLTIMQTCRPNRGNSLKQGSENDYEDTYVFWYRKKMGLQGDFFKKIALDCAKVHIAVDLFMFNSKYADLTTLSNVSKYSGGELKFYPKFHDNSSEV
jgi:protein transport protein SEC24